MISQNILLAYLGMDVNCTVEYQRQPIRKHYSAHLDCLDWDMCMSYVLSVLILRKTSGKVPTRSNYPKYHRL